MANIVESITYNGIICNFEKNIGNIDFYTYMENKDDDEEHLLLVDKSNKEVLANIVVAIGYGAYGMEINGYKIEEE